MSIYSWIKFQRIKTMVENVNDAISDTRSRTMTKEGSYEMVVCKDADNTFVAKLYQSRGTANEKVLETFTVGKYGSIYCIDRLNPAIEYKVEDGNTICLAFSKGDGRFTKMLVELPDGTTKQIQGSFIYFKYADLVKRLKLVELTGKH